MTPARPPAVERWVLVACVLATTMVFLDATALNVAVPAIQQSLAASGAQMLWVVNAYAIPLTACVLVAGALGDRLGRKRVFGWGILGFVAASVLCGLAPSPGLLIAARVAQGIGGAAVIPGSLALITATFPRAERGRAIGVWSACTVVAMALGPVVGGVLATWGLWRVVFFINVPLAMVCGVALRRVSESRDAESHAIDVTGAWVVVVGLAAVSFALIEGPQRGWGDLLVLTALGVAGLAAPLFVWIESRATEPMLPLALFREPTFRAANAMTVLLYTAFHATMFFVPLNLVQLQGYPAHLAGLAQLPVMGMVIGLSPVAGKWTDRFGPRGPLLVGQWFAAAGLIGLAQVGIAPPARYWTTYFGPLLLLGAGMGLTIAPLSTTIMNSVSLDRAGVASGINSMMSRLASVLAMALLGGGALLVFRTELQANIGDVLPGLEQEMLAQADRFGDAAPPPRLPSAEARIAQHAIDSAFLEAFKAVAWGGAALALLGSALVIAIRSDRDAPG